MTKQADLAATIYDKLLYIAQDIDILAFAAHYFSDAPNGLDKLAAMSTEVLNAWSAYVNTLMLIDEVPNEKGGD